MYIGMSADCKSEEIKSGVNEISSRECSDVEQKIITQIEYYFGDINLPRDKFLQLELKKDDGWIPLSTMLQFKRLSLLTDDVKLIASSLRRSKLMEVSDDGSKIRRNPGIEVPEISLEYWQSVKIRTAYVKGFSESTTLDELLRFFNQFGEVANVVMRREKNETHTFKGSVFCTFGDVETAKAFISNDVKEYNGSPLLKMMQNDFWAMKQREQKEKREADRKAKLAKKLKDAEEQKREASIAHFVKGLVLSLSNLPKDTNIQKLKEFLKNFGDVGYVVYSQGDDQAQIRFSGNEFAAKKAWEAAIAASADGKVMMNDNEIHATVLDGVEEEKYWDDFNQKKAEKFIRSQKRGRGKPQNGRSSRKRAANNVEGEPANKQKRIVFKDDDVDKD
ncbi:unnamed protein product [Dracunculus medinensis]|uniref:Lupus La protein n=1 Tax=Dracunculus medinensis TaxID=318479 RepID=A0A0N4UI96_DRAME|nr:unnamed protein product [Dracunculus medinensis]